MRLQLRQLSLLLRRRRAVKERSDTLRAFDQWRELQAQLDPPTPPRRKLLLIRLDDIGDYLLFRNQLAMYKQSQRWAEFDVTLLGNSTWRPIFEALDGGTVDDTLWVDKARYLSNAAYRMRIWAQLRQGGFEIVIAPSRTRPLLLDDLCRLAAAPVLSIGSVNTYVHSLWNERSDALYQQLFKPDDLRVHEFHFNAQFALWCTGNRYTGSRPTIVQAPEPDGSHGGPKAVSAIVCFIGANTRSRRWPARRWIEFINSYGDGNTGSVILAGNTRAEQEMARIIQAATGATSIVGKVSLEELLRTTGEAKAVVSNDSMGAHLGVSCGRPTIIIANGVNYERFTDYDRAGIDGVTTLYPSIFIRKRQRQPEASHTYSDALTADIATIRARQVLSGLQALLTTSEARDSSRKTEIPDARSI